MRLPDFYIVGAAKSGTTSVWHYLGQHSQIFMTDDIRNKELGYFCHHYGINDIEEYKKFFAAAKPDQIIGESCHAYLSSPESAQMIYNERPDAKIIMILRNPVDRAYSLYNWMIANGYESANSLTAALHLEKVRSISKEFIHSNPHGFYQNYFYYQSGLYSAQIDRYFQLFGKSNCNVLIFEDFKKNPVTNMKAVFSFLGVDDNFIPKTEIHNESQRVIKPSWQFYFRWELGHKLMKRGISFNTASKCSERLMKMNVLNSKPKPLAPDLRNQLINQYREDIFKVQELLNRDLSLWLR